MVDAVVDPFPLQVDHAEPRSSAASLGALAVLTRSPLRRSCGGAALSRLQTASQWGDRCAGGALPP
jgi:hypothetical protein